MGLFPPKRTIQTWSEVGKQVETFITARLMEVGYTVLIPVDGTQRYDLVIEDANGQFWRIQCKKGKWRDGSVCFAAGKRVWGSMKESYDYHGSVDYFAVYSPDTQTVYLVPISVVGSNSCQLRVDPLSPQYRSRERMRWAADYKL
jgi:hypothetical protein